MSPQKTNAKVWQPDSDTVIIGEAINSLAFKNCCRDIGTVRSKEPPQMYSEKICFYLDELLNKNVGAISPTLKTYFGLDNKAYQNTTNRPKWAKILADNVKLYLDGKLADTAKEIAFRCIDNWFAGIEAQEPPPTATDEQATAPQLPSELEGARVFFERAVNAGYMTITATGAKWEKKQSMLGYFCLLAFERPRPITAIEQYFSIRNLSASITQVDVKDNEVKRADVRKWRAEMRKEIFHNSPD